MFRIARACATSWGSPESMAPIRPIADADGRRLVHPDEQAAHPSIVGVWSGHRQRSRPKVIMTSLNC